MLAWIAKCAPNKVYGGFEIHDLAEYFREWTGNMRVNLRFLENALYLLVWLFSLSLSFVVFVLYLQTPVVSTLRLLIIACSFTALVVINGFVLSHWIIPAFVSVSNPNVLALIAFLLPVLFLPFYYISADFPISPLLREQTDVAVQFALSDLSQPLELHKDDIRLIVGDEVFGLESFTVQNGADILERVTIPAGGSEFFQWQGSADEVVTLNIELPPAQGTLTVYWDRSRAIYQLTPDAPMQIVMKHKFETPVALNALYTIAQYFILAYIIFILVILLKDHLPRAIDTLMVNKSRLALFILAALLGFLILELHIMGMIWGLDALNGEQMERHMDVLRGNAPSPWQYRVLSEWIAEGFIRLFAFLPPRKAVIYGFLAFRYLQHLFIFWAAYLLYQRLGNFRLAGLFGVILLLSSIKNATFESDLSFNTYFDLLFYLLAVLFIMDKRYLWITPLMVFASLNRETCGLIPFLLLAATLTDNSLPLSRKIIYTILPLVVWVLIFFGLRAFYPDRPLYIPYDRAPGYSLMIYNLTRSITWTELFRSLGFIPFLGLPFFFVWHSYWKRFFFVMIPAWIVIHALASVMAEARLFLVPQAIVFIPSVLFMFKHISQDSLSEKLENKSVAGKIVVEGRELENP